jgi:hypothetical protein
MYTEPYASATAAMVRSVASLIMNVDVFTSTAGGQQRS